MSEDALDRHFIRFAIGTIAVSFLALLVGLVWIIVTTPKARNGVAIMAAVVTLGYLVGAALDRVGIIEI